MLRRTWVLGLLLLCVSGCDAAGKAADVKGSGTKGSVTRTVPKFRRVALKASADLTIKVGGEPSVTIEADENLLAHFTTEVAADELTIASDQSYTTSSGVKITVTAPALEGVALLGSGSIGATGVAAKSLAVKLAGSGNITLAGSAERAAATLTGSGNVRMFDLVTKEAHVNLGGSGNVEVNATDTAQLNIGGSGNITYMGNPPHLQQNVTGSGKIKAR
jgi:hypothetical protein